jgi:hypothetical protein
MLTWSSLPNGVQKMLPNRGEIGDIASDPVHEKGVPPSFYQGGRPQ